jgi:uncharacterized protein with von Willebrand factor type A (vWA) domain
MFNSLFGQAGYAAAAQPMLNQLGSLAGQYNQNQAFSSQHAANMLAQQQAAFNAAQLGKLGQLQHRFMIDGRSMTFDDFLDEVAPGDDNPQRTFLILKYKK